jgi:hypothetical protein
MNRLAKTPRGASVAGVITAAIVALAIFALGAPGWVLVPIMFAGCTAYAELGSWVDRRLGRRH